MPMYVSNESSHPAGSVSDPEPCPDCGRVEACACVAERLAVVSPVTGRTTKPGPWDLTLLYSAAGSVRLVPPLPRARLAKPQPALPVEQTRVEWTAAFVPAEPTGSMKTDREGTASLIDETFRWVRRLHWLYVGVPTEGKEALRRYLTGPVASHGCAAVALAMGRDASDVARKVDGELRPETGFLYAAVHPEVWIALLGPTDEQHETTWSELERAEREVTSEWPIQWRRLRDFVKTGTDRISLRRAQRPRRRR